MADPDKDVEEEQQQQQQAEEDQKGQKGEASRAMNKAMVDKEDKVLDASKLDRVETLAHPPLNRRYIDRSETLEDLPPCLGFPHLLEKMDCSYMEKHDPVTGILQHHDVIVISS